MQQSVGYVCKLHTEDFCAFVLRWPVLAAPLKTPGEGKVGKGVGERGRDKIGEGGQDEREQCVY